MAAGDETEQEEKKGASIFVQIAVLLVMTAATAGVGWLTGGKLGETAVEETVKEAHPDSVADTHPEKEEGAGEGEATVRPEVYLIDPITTNLAAPDSVWTRLEVALVFDGEPDASIADQIHQDLLAFMRTVKLSQIDSASGFRHLKADFEERADIRSEGRVKGVLIRTLLFE